MSETNGTSGGSKRLLVYAVPDKKDGDRTFWPKIGVAFTNRDGSIAILLDALPLGTNRLHVREQRDDGRPTAGGGSRRNGQETVEVQP